VHRQRETAEANNTIGEAKGTRAKGRIGNQRGSSKGGMSKAKGSSRRAKERLVSHLTGRKTAKACHMLSYNP